LKQYVGDEVATKADEWSQKEIGDIIGGEMFQRLLKRFLKRSFVIVERYKIADCPEN
jgi:hypothetical protein